MTIIKANSTKNPATSTESLAPVPFFSEDIGLIKYHRDEHTFESFLSPNVAHLKFNFFWHFIEIAGMGYIR